MRLFLLLVALPVSLLAQAPTYAHAKQQFDGRNYDAARRELTALTSANPADVPSIILLGRIALNEGDIDQGVQQFERCVRVDDNSADCHFWLGNALGNAAQRANRFRQGLLARRVKTEFERAVAIDPHRVEARIGLVQFYMLAPGFLGGSMEKAREQAAEIDRRNRHRGAIALGTIAEHEKDGAGAEAAYRRAIVAAPDSGGGYYALITLYAKERRWTDAFTTADRLAAAMPADRTPLLVIGRLAALSGEQLPRGEQSLSQWLAAPPKEAGDVAKASAHARLGTVYERMGRRELARAEYQTALRLDSRNEDAKRGIDGLKG